MKETEEVKRAKAVVQRRCFSFAAQLAELLKLDPAALIPGAAIAPRALSPKALKAEALDLGAALAPRALSPKALKAEALDLGSAPPALSYIEISPPSFPFSA